VADGELDLGEVVGLARRLVRIRQVDLARRPGHLVAVPRCDALAFALLSTRGIKGLGCWTDGAWWDPTPPQPVSDWTGIKALRFGSPG
jgi:hypothetical protein